MSNDTQQKIPLIRRLRTYFLTGLVVDAARKSIIRQARKLQDQGELILASPEGGDFV